MIENLAYAWGNNTYGQLGDNSTTSKSVPTSVSSAISWKQISAGGGYSTAAINSENGLAYAWGYNAHGQLGDNSTTSKSVPTSVSSAISWKQISAGDNHTVAINGANGLAYAWGGNGQGELGNNTKADKSVPTSVSSTISWKQISAGGNHTVAINGANGLAYAWGDNVYGELGNNSTIDRSVPRSVSSGRSWKQISAGGNHTVAINGADGLAYAWGDNSYGELGNNSITTKSVPTSVSSTISWKQISGGNAHTVAINGANGLAYAWGRNDSGQLGDNSGTNKSVPTSVSSTISWTQISGGNNHTVAINGANGLAYAWGANYYGQLGDNSITNKSVPTSVSSTISWKEISGGSAFTLGIGSVLSPVGPPSVKTFAGINIETIDNILSVPIANIKSINGIQ